MSTEKDIPSKTVGSGSTPSESVTTVYTPKVDMSGLPEVFSGQNFKRWQQRMDVWLTIKGLISVLETDCPKPSETDPNSALLIRKWKEQDQVVRGCILSALDNTLFDVYCKPKSTAKALWERLDMVYNAEDVGAEKYSVSKFLNFQMVEGVSVTEQAHQLEFILHTLAEADMTLPVKFRVMAIIEKFPKSWEDFGMYLKHKKENIALTDLMTAIAIEEEHRSHGGPSELRTNFLSSKWKGKQVNRNPNKGKGVFKPKSKIQKKPKANKPCWNCGQAGHWARDCPSKKAKAQQASSSKAQHAPNNKAQINMVEVEPLPSTEPNLSQEGQ